MGSRKEGVEEDQGRQQKRQHSTAHTAQANERRKRQAESANEEIKERPDAGRSHRALNAMRVVKAAAGSGPTEGG